MKYSAFLLYLIAKVLINGSFVAALQGYAPSHGLSRLNWKYNSLVFKRVAYPMSSSLLSTPEFISHGFEAFQNYVHAGDILAAKGDISRTIDIFHNYAEMGSGTLITASSEPSKTLDILGNDLLIFLCATIGIVPLFKRLNESPVLGFLAAGLLMGPAGLKLFEDLGDMETLAEFGVLFLLFEQGLELTVERLTSLSKYAFGMGTLQVLLCTTAFFIFPFIGGVPFLEIFFGADANVVDITRLDESLVIGAALSLSSSAFVLKILQEKNQLSSKFGSASLGILLLQDIAVVPLLVLLPIIENNSGGSMLVSEQAAIVGVCKCS